MYISNHTEEIERLHEEISVLSKRINEEKTRHQELDRERKGYLDAIKISRAKIEGEGGIAGLGNNNDIRIATSIKILENRLEQALLKFNDSLTNNKKLRAEIEELRLDKGRFDKQFTVLQASLVQKKKEMARVIEIANEAYEERDASVQEIQQIKATNTKEESTYIAEVEQLNVILRGDRECKERQLQTVGTPESFEAEQQKKKNEHAGSVAAAWEKQSATLVNQVKEFEDNFRLIREATGSENDDELVPKFSAIEEENIKMFNFLTELNSEMEKSQDVINGLKAEVKENRGSLHDDQRLRILEDLAEKVHRSEERATRYEQQYQDCMQMIADVKVELTSIVDLVGDEAAVAEAHKNDGITDSNVMLFTGIIEQRTNEALLMKALLESKQVVADHAEATKAVAFPFASPKTPCGFLAPTVTFPNSEDFVDENEDNDEEVRPLSHTELKQRILERPEKATEKTDTTTKNKTQHRPSFSLDRMHLPLPASTRLRV